MANKDDDYLKDMSKGGQTPPEGNDNGIGDIVEDIGNKNPVEE